MGMYTEIFFRAEVDEEAFGAIKALHHGDSTLRMPSHPFFETDRGAYITSMSSFYHPHANHFEAERIDGVGETMYFISFRADLKNYDDEIEKFFDWVTPHCRQRDYPKTFIGYHLYEGDCEPTLYYKEES